MEIKETQDSIFINGNEFKNEDKQIMDIQVKENHHSFMVVEVKFIVDSFIKEKFSDGSTD